MSDKTQEIPEDMAVRLIGLMQLGAFVQGADGHFWIHCDGDNDYLDRILRKGGVLLNNKIYEGLATALDTIDEALRLAESPDLAAHGADALQDQLGLGQYGIAHNRIAITAQGRGGVH